MTNRVRVRVSVVVEDPKVTNRAPQVVMGTLEYAVEHTLNQSAFEGVPMTPADSVSKGHSPGYGRLLSTHVQTPTATRIIQAKAAF